MTVLLLEDETLAAERLQNLLLEAEPGSKVVAQLKSVEAAIAWLQSNTHPDLILSDIRLLDGLCFEIFEKVNVEKPVIFTSAYDQYAIKAFEVNSIDYLLKPVQQEKLKLALDKVKSRTGKPVAPPTDFTELVKLLQGGAKPDYKSRFMVRLGQKIVAIPVEKVAYFFSENKLTFLITQDQKRYPMDQPLDELIEVLNPKVFFRANRQFIVTFQSIAEIHPYFKGRIKLQLNPVSVEEVVISSDRTPEFKKWIDQ
jgi:two-component system, LytTR family, response regulator LytT